MVDVRIRDEGNTKTLDILVDPGPRSTRTIVRVEGATDMLALELESHLVERGLVDGVVLDPGAVEREALSYLRANGYLRAQVSVGAPLFEGRRRCFLCGSMPVLSSLSRRSSSRVRAACRTRCCERRRSWSRDAVQPCSSGGGAQSTGGAAPAGGLRRGDGIRAAGGIRGCAARRCRVRRDGGRPRHACGRGRCRQRGIDTDVVLRAIDLPLARPQNGGAAEGPDPFVQHRTVPPHRYRVRAGRVSAANDAVAPKRLRVTVEEWPALRLRYGVLVAEEFRADDIERRELVPELSADVSRRTLFGRAITVGAARGGSVGSRVIERI